MHRCCRSCRPARICCTHTAAPSRTWQLHSQRPTRHPRPCPHCSHASPYCAPQMLQRKGLQQQGMSAGFRGPQQGPAVPAPVQDRPSVGSLFIPTRVVPTNPASPGRAQPAADSTVCHVAGIHLPSIPGLFDQMPQQQYQPQQRKPAAAPVAVAPPGERRAGTRSGNHCRLPAAAAATRVCTCKLPRLNAQQQQQQQQRVCLPAGLARVLCVAKPGSST